MRVRSPLVPPILTGHQMLEQPMFEGMYNEKTIRKKSNPKKSVNVKDNKIKKKNISSDGSKVKDGKTPISHNKEKYVTIANDCDYLRDNNLGLYCCWGTRKVRRLKKGKKSNIVCLDCDETGKSYMEVSDAVLRRLEEKKRNG